MEDRTQQTSLEGEKAFSRPRPLRDILIVAAPIVGLGVIGNVIGPENVDLSSRNAQFIPGMSATGRGRPVRSPLQRICRGRKKVLRRKDAEVLDAPVHRAMEKERI